MSCCQICRISRNLINLRDIEYTGFGSIFSMMIDKFIQSLFSPANDNNEDIVLYKSFRKSFANALKCEPVNLLLELSNRELQSEHT